MFCSLLFSLHQLLFRFVLSAPHGQFLRTVKFRGALTCYHPWALTVTCQSRSYYGICWQSFSSYTWRRCILVCSSHHQALFVIEITSPRLDLSRNKMDNAHPRSSWLPSRAQSMRYAMVELSLSRSKLSTSHPRSIWPPSRAQCTRYAMVEQILLHSSLDTSHPRSTRLPSTRIDFMICYGWFLTLFSALGVN